MPVRTIQSIARALQSTRYTIILHEIHATADLEDNDPREQPIGDSKECPSATCGDRSGIPSDTADAPTPVLRRPVLTPSTQATSLSKSPTPLEAKKKGQEKTNTQMRSTDMPSSHNKDSVNLQPRSGTEDS